MPEQDITPINPHDFIEKVDDFDFTIHAEEISSISDGLSKLEQVNPRLYGTLQAQLSLINQDGGICPGLAEAELYTGILRGATQYHGWTYYMSMRKAVCKISIWNGKYLIKAEGNQVKASLEAYLTALASLKLSERNTNAPY